MVYQNIENRREYDSRFENIISLIFATLISKNCSQVAESDCVEYSTVLDKVVEELNNENEQNHEELERIGNEIDKFKADFPDRD